MAATAAHTVSTLEINAQDDMDLHSDGGLDFGDGDIELDLDPVPVIEPHDDDVSINDAATDTAVDVQTVSADQDDFMVDNETIVEEHNVYFGDEAVADPIPMDDDATVQEPSLAPPDEDLIDYSDEEEELPMEQDDVEIESLQVEVTDVHAEVHAEDAADNTEAFVPAGPSAEEEHSQHNEDDHDVEHGVGKHIPRQVPTQAVDTTTNDDSDGGEGGVSLKEHELHADDDEDDHGSDAYPGTRPAEARPITINYEGNELWLFREHDTENSGDWLLEDSSMVHSSLSDFLQSCRAALGEDISPETELGLRFDHLLNMELYEDNTACVAVSLDRLIDLYYTLHAQDGNTEPDSFYMSLLSRPRFASLLADIAKYAEQGSGYSGLTSAVAAGETHFPETYSGHSTEYENTERENEDEEEEEKSEHTKSLSESETAESQKAASEEAEDPNDEEAQAHEHEQNGEDEDIVYEDYTNADESEPQTVEDSGAAVAEQEVPGQVTQQELQAAEAIRKEQEAHDTVDYSDDEYDDAADIPPHVPSTSSSTVQGDEPAIAGDVSTWTGSFKHDQEEGTDSHVEVNDSHGQEEPEYDAYAPSYEQVDPHATAESYESDLDHGDDETHESTQQSPVIGQNNEIAEPNVEGYTNEEYTGYDYQTLDQQLQEDFLSGADYNGNGPNDDDVNNYTGADGYLDLNDASEWVPDQDNNAYLPDDAFLSHDDGTAALEQEEEDGVVEQPTIEASSAADPIATSSTKDKSPLGQKRCIDEVGDMVDNAPEFADPKRQRM